MKKVYLEWWYGWNFDPLPDFCEDAFGAMGWIIHDHETKKGIGDVEAGRCNNEVDFTARLINDVPEVTAVGRSSVPTNPESYERGVALALAEIDLLLVESLPIGEVLEHRKEKQDGAHG